ncbi:MAG: rRNA maturation RNase YbeY [Candidatus Omnitrophica bacterium]|nr:rRNA maturation RNase YbeY [Candidatus Omnitrophota bacterium]
MPPGKAKLRVLNLHPAYRVNERVVKKIALYVLRPFCARGSAEVGFIFLTDRKIRALNKRYKGENRPTDVLSFDLSSGRSRKVHPLLGEIFISIDRARDNAASFDTALEEEFVLYIIHGILHLTGYDDETSKARARMEKAQERILRDLCKRENLSKVLTPR